MSKEGIIYFELNNWTCGEHYPAEEPFLTWFESDRNLYFNNAQWVKENKLCVVRSIIDMSVNFCITATKSWVEENCPRLLTHHQNFLRKPDEDGCVYGYWGDEFLPYTEENIGGLLEFRAIGKKIRRSGGRTKGMPKRTLQQDVEFENTLDDLLKDLRNQIGE